mmetsp:Transcript_20842/g.67129  ORF Transcript_20842/g.67129 Transcript_20842/m.67129 type:complete len:422 (+) Transcript_20842:77-1342(+)
MCAWCTSCLRTSMRFFVVVVADGSEDEVAGLGSSEDLACADVDDGFGEVEVSGGLGGHVDGGGEVDGERGFEGVVDEGRLVAEAGDVLDVLHKVVHGAQGDVREGLVDRLALAVEGVEEPIRRHDDDAPLPSLRGIQHVAGAVSPTLREGLQHHERRPQRQLQGHVVRAEDSLRRGGTRRFWCRRRRLRNCRSRRRNRRRVVNWRCRRRRAFGSIRGSGGRLFVGGLRFLGKGLLLLLFRRGGARFVVVLVLDDDASFLLLLALGGAASLGDCRDAGAEFGVDDVDDAVVFPRAVGGVVEVGLDGGVGFPGVDAAASGGGGVQEDVVGRRDGDAAVDFHGPRREEELREARRRRLPGRREGGGGHLVLRVGEPHVEGPRLQRDIQVSSSLGGSSLGGGLGGGFGGLCFFVHGRGGGDVRVE